MKSKRDILGAGKKKFLFHRPRRHHNTARIQSQYHLHSNTASSKTDYDDRENSNRFDNEFKLKQSGEALRDGPS